MGISEQLNITQQRSSNFYLAQFQEVLWMEKFGKTWAGWRRRRVQWEGKGGNKSHPGWTLELDILILHGYSSTLTVLRRIEHASRNDRRSTN